MKDLKKDYEKEAGFVYDDEAHDNEQLEFYKAYAEWLEKKVLYIHPIITTTVQATYDWFKNETIIVNKNDATEVTGYEVELKENAKQPLEDYVMPALRKLNLIPPSGN